MKKTLIATLAAVLVSSAALPAMAAPRGDGPRGAPRIERLMERFDADRDGAVILEEIHAQRHGMFNSVDADGSGALSPEEFGMLRDIQRQERLEARKDRQAQGYAMRDDMRGFRTDRRDERRDGRMAGRQDESGDWRGQGVRDGRGGWHDQDRRDARFNPDRGPGSMAFYDTDGNGQVSLEEFTAFDGKMFERFDRNGNGEIEITDFYQRPKAAN